MAIRLRGEVPLPSKNLGVQLLLQVGTYRRNRNQKKFGVVYDSDTERDHRLPNPQAAVTVEARR